jgi:hypothetical protein
VSYDITNHVHARRASADARAQAELEDAQRLDFLKRLDNAEFEVTEWEAEFIASILKTEARFAQAMKTMGAKVSQISFTDRQRAKIDQMRGEYEHRLGSAKAEVRSAKLPESVPGKCDFLIRENGQTRRCGEPAIKTLSRGLQLCEAHEAQRQLEIERQRQFRTRHMRS